MRRLREPQGRGATKASLEESGHWGRTGSQEANTEKQQQPRPLGETQGPQEAPGWWSPRAHQHIEPVPWGLRVKVKEQGFFCFLFLV